ncbi:MAG: metallophosphoesterase [Candidatus Omnitrophica bacterium]|nr:metallophosphoesterase [Candidatus Omnitrophota bacterium]
MKIGILSDSHDNLIKVDHAIKFFNKHKVGFVFHAGDFVAPFTVLKMKELETNWAGVYGNNDGEKNGLFVASEGRIKDGPRKMELEGKKIILTHELFKVAPEVEEAEIIIYGHSHKPEIKTINSKLLINPGECGGWLFGKSTVAILDLDGLNAKIFDI